MRLLPMMLALLFLHILQPRPAVMPRIQGRITDLETGKPVAGMRVQLISWSYTADGVGQPDVLSFVESGELGDYTIPIPSRRRFFVSTGSFRTDDKIFVPTFYPGAFDIARATPLNLMDGADRAGIDIAVRSGKTVTIRGKFIDGLGHRYPHWDWVWLRPRYESPEVATMIPTLGGNIRLRYENAGTYEIRDVLPGSYHLMSFRFDEIQHRSVTMIPVEVTDKPLEVDIVSEASYPLNGRIRFEGPRFSILDTRPAAAPIVQIIARSLAGAPMETPAATIYPTGMFSFLPLPEGAFRLSILGVPAPFYVKSARFGAAGPDVLENGMTFPGRGTESLEIRIAGNGGQVRGAVADGAGSSVVLVPQGRPLLRPDLYKVAEADNNGRFTVGGIAPGAYRLYAWKSVAGRIYFDEEFMQTFGGRGVPVEVQAGGLTEVQLRLLQ